MICDGNDSSSEPIEFEDDLRYKGAPLSDGFPSLLDCLAKKKEGKNKKSKMTFFLDFPTPFPSPRTLYIACGF